MPIKPQTASPVAAPLSLDELRAQAQVCTALVTLHPSALPRITDRAARDTAHARFVDDLRLAHKLLG